MGFFYNVPAGVFLVLALALALLASASGQKALHRRFPDQDFIAHNEVGGILIAVSGTLYAVVLGFLTVVAWQHYVDARQLVVEESNADIDVWHSTTGLPAAAKTRIRADMLNYAHIMVEREWPLMRRGGVDEKAAYVSMDAMDVDSRLIPANSGEANAQLESLRQLTRMHDARQQRIAVNESGVSWFEWLVLLIGAFCIIGFCWLFGVRSALMQLVMTSTVVTITVSLLVLLFELQYPFRSDIGVGPQPWENALAHLGEMQKGEMPGMRM